VKSLFGIKLGRKRTPISYEDSKRLARDENSAVRADLATRDDLRPEVLYFLAEDPTPEVRRRIAGNEDTPIQADRLLAKDADESVRQDLAAKLSRLVPRLSAQDQEQTEAYVVETLEILARDQAVRVRQILTEALHDLAGAPPAVIHALARDAEEVVACPVLRFSPLLSDQDLIEIIGEGCASGKLTAISRRRDLAAPVCDVVVATDDRPAITALLNNKSAQIREETLDTLVERSRAIEAWHQPLVERPKLSLKMIDKLAGFVADTLLKKLQTRADLDKAMAERLTHEVRRRLSSGGDEAGFGSAETNEVSPAEQAQRLHQSGDLGDEALQDALARGDRSLVREGLVLLSGLDAGTVERILEAGSAKGMTALAWKAGLSMRSAMQMQLRLCGIPPGQVLNARNGTEYPLDPDEMDWQLSFFGSLSA